MVLKNNKIQVIYFDCFIAFTIIFMVSFGYFLGREINPKSFIIYFIIILVTIVVAIVIYLLYTIFYNNYTEINMDKIIVYKNHKIVKEIDVMCIKKCVYYSVFYMILGNDCGGKLRVIYDNGTKTEELFISMSNKQSEIAKQILNIKRH